jgi:hypothetical protein
LAERNPESPPFEELRVSGLLERRHHRPSDLSSRWIGLQSSTHASSTVLIGCSHRTLSIHRLARRLTASPVLRGLRCASCWQQVNTTSDSHALCLASRVRIRKRVPATSHAANGTSISRRPSHEVLRLYDAYGKRQRPTPGLPHLAVLRPQAFSASRRFIPPHASPALFHAGNAPELLPTEDSPFR